MTWKEIKLAALQKMFSASGSTIPNDETTNDYIAAMPQAANEALQLLCTSNKFLRKYTPIEQQAEQGEDSFYDIQEYAQDFHSFGVPEVYLEYGTGKIKAAKKITIRAGRYISFDTAVSGTFRVFYNSWPERITTTTEDDYELPLENDVVNLLPLYIASELYKDDDISLATLYRYEFEAARSELTPAASGEYRDFFYDESGWV